MLPIHSLLIGNVWEPVIYQCACPIHCKVHWRVDRRLGSCRLIPAQPLIGLTIREFSISSALSVLEIVCCLYFHSFLNQSQYIIVDGCRSKLVKVWSGVPQGYGLGPLLFFLYTSALFSILENKFIGFAADSNLLSVVSSPGIGVNSSRVVSVSP